MLPIRLSGWVTTKKEEYYGSCNKKETSETGSNAGAYF